jgi:hypothetical protein
MENGLDRKRLLFSVLDTLEVEEVFGDFIRLGPGTFDIAYDLSSRASETSARVAWQYRCSPLIYRTENSRAS